MIVSLRGMIDLFHFNGLLLFAPTSHLVRLSEIFNAFLVLFNGYFIAYLTTSQEWAFLGPVPKSLA